MSMSGCGCGSDEAPIPETPSASLEIGVPSEESGDSTGGETETEESETVSTKPGMYGTLGADWTAPAIGATSSFAVADAGSWGVVGASVWFPGFGFVKITGKSGDTLTVTNTDIVEGSLITEGAQGVQVGPLAGLTEALIALICAANGCVSCDEEAVDLACFDGILVCKGGQLYAITQANMQALMSSTQKWLKQTPVEIADHGTDPGGTQVYAVPDVPAGATHAIVRVFADVDDNPAGNITLRFGSVAAVRTLESQGESHAVSLVSVPISGGNISYILEETDPGGMDFSGNTGILLELVGYEKAVSV